MQIIGATSYHVKIGLVLAAAGVINGYCFYLYAFQLE
jgi:hypothetical protein